MASRCKLGAHGGGPIRRDSLVALSISPPPSTLRLHRCGGLRGTEGRRYLSYQSRCRACPAPPPLCIFLVGPRCNMRAWTSVGDFEIKPITTQLPLFACGQRHGARDEGTEGRCQTISTRLLRPRHSSTITIERALRCRPTGDDRKNATLYLTGCPHNLTFSLQKGKDLADPLPEVRAHDPSFVVVHQHPRLTSQSL